MFLLRYWKSVIDSVMELAVIYGSCCGYANSSHGLEVHDCNQHKAWNATMKISVHSPSNSLQKVEVVESTLV